MSEQKHYGIQDHYDYPANEHPQPQAEVSTPLGPVRLHPINDPLPEGWSKLTMQEGKAVRVHLNQLLSFWSIVAFEQGKLDGPGYGSAFSNTYGPECGEVFIVRRHGAGAQ